MEQPDKIVTEHHHQQYAHALQEHKAALTDAISNLSDSQQRRN